MLDFHLVPPIRVLMNLDEGGLVMQDLGCLLNSLFAAIALKCFCCCRCLKAFDFHGRNGIIFGAISAINFDLD